MTDHDAEWLTIREAALKLDVSDLTIRRRIKDGRLTHRLHNGKYYVNLSGPPKPPIPRDHRLATDAANEGAGTSYQPLRAGGRGSVQPEVSDQPLPQVDEGVPRDAEAGGARAPAPGVPALDLDALLAEHARLAELAGRAGVLQEQLSELAARNSELQTGVLSLSSRNGWLESKLEEREQSIKLLTDSRRRVPWWKRLLGASDTT